MAKLQLSFHTTFALKKAELARLMPVAGQTLSKEALMAHTGFGNKKIGPIKSWATRGGLIKEGALTPEGSLVLKYDPHLTSRTTEWLLHFYLSFGGYGLAVPPANIAEWGGWPYFIFSFRPNHPEFTEDDLAAEGAIVFDDKPELIKSNFSFLIRAYTSHEGLARCRVITWSDTDKRYQTGSPELPNCYLLGYFLACLWTRDFSDTTSVITDQLLSMPAGISAVLGLREQETATVLDDLEGRSIIEQRRTVAPFQVVRRWHSAIELLEKAFQYGDSH